MVSLVLLGAGASFGSESGTQPRPPLGYRLFDELEQAGGVAATLPDDIKTLFRKDFESGMALYRERFNDDTSKFQRELALHLARFQPSDDSAYIKLIRSIPLNRAIFSSLNYDLLFEIAARKLGINTHYGSDYNRGQVRLLKPHGSANFWPDTGTNVFINVKFAGNKVDIEAPIRTLNDTETIRRCMSETSLAPAMAMYAEGKAVKVCPQFIRNQQEQWNAVVRAARSIFISGVRVHPVDTHIWDELGKARGSVNYYGFPGDREPFHQWKESSKKKNAYFFESSFSEAIDLIRGRML